MPEIAEIARITHFLRQHLVGRKISKVVAQDDSNVFGKVGTSAAAFQEALKGKRVVSAGNQGKYFWLELDASPHPVMHLGMTGWVHIRGVQTEYNRYAEKTKGADKDAWPPRFWKFHLETEVEKDGDNLPVCVAYTDARRFGRIRLVDCPGPEIRSHSPLVENGPDPVVDRARFTEDYLRQKMGARHVPIKALLLDQAMISGIGNWVGDEIMYQAALHPEQYSDDFSDAEITRLYRAICYVCDTAVEKLGDSEQFPKDWLFEHRWGKGKKDATKTLPNGERLVFITVGGRTSCIVPSRQKKTGRVAGGIKEEPESEAEPKPKAKRSVVKTETIEKKSRYFAGDEGSAAGGVAKQDEPLKKKAKTTASGADKSKPLKAMADSDPKAGARKSKERGTIAAAPPDTSRRRSARIAKTVSE
ncbi:formamidopyrimidine-DNA glycosylase [Poronia punctata]|nr:formamidopyrimidine-DNA glycosylase [Poronia punctata]